MIKKLMRKTLPLILAAMILLASGCAQKPAAPYLTPLLVGEKKISVQIVTSKADMEQGLSGRARMPDNQGMLFDFGQQAIDAPFWMKNMEFGLDLIWIRGNKIIGLTPNVPAPKSSRDVLSLYYPPSPVDMVLEVNAGWSKKNNIAVGDAVQVITNNK